ncbi:hypothetical protein FRC00_001703 [Tulasnella sp. 408]|nr:hypothetical protein FRC00_001703 [Tulasnella sp. 408]
MDRLRQEVLAAYGESGVPTFENIKTLKYLRAILDEVLRLFPPVPINVRSPFNDATVVPTRQGPLYVSSAGMLCTWSVPSMHKRKDLWGEDADKFDPERWIDPAKARKVVDNPFMFLPFNGGPRICIGQQFAYNEASFVMIRLMQLFDRFTLAQKEAAPASALPPAAWKTAGGRKPVEEAWPKNAITLYSKAKMFDIEYRLWLLRRLSNLLLPPLAAVYAALRLLDDTSNPFVPKSLLARTACYIISLPLYWAGWIRLSNWDNERRARKLGARLPPLIKSKKFGGLDLRERLVNGMTNDYVGVVFDEMLDEVGADTARLSILWSERVITRDPDVLKFVVSTGFPHFGKGELTEIRFRGLLGRGIFASDGERAKMHRALARPYFARERVSDYNTFQRHSAKVCDILINHAKQSRPCDVQDLFARFTMDTAGEFLFGRDDFGTLDMPLTQPGAEMVEGAKSATVEGGYGSFVNAFETAQVLITKRLAMGPYGWAMAEFFNDSVKKHTRVVDSYLEPIVRDAVQRRKNLKPEEKGEYESFLDHLADSTSDVQLIKDQLLNILLAARDTTAQLLSWTCYVLALHPDIMDRLRQEVLATYGESEEPTFENIKTLKYLRAVLDEVLRLFPPVPVNGRSPFNDATVVPTRQGPLYFSSAGMLCNWSVSSMRKHKDLWGEDADKFDPDRWIDLARARKVVDNPFMFLPFNGGPRICIGQQFAYNEASFVMVRLMQLFDRFTLAQKDAAPASALPPASWKNSNGRKRIEEAWPKSALTIYSKGGMWIKMHLASSSS